MRPELDLNRSAVSRAYLRAQSSMNALPAV